MIFQMVAACSCDVVILFMFCVSGEIVIHFNDISNDVYSLPWYQFDARAKFAVYLMIFRTQKPYQFAPYKTINCSLELFILV